MWETIKRILQKGGGKCIIVENDKPSYVVLPMEEYENLLEQSQIEEANQEITELKSQEETEPAIEDVADKKEDEVKVEDLPF